MFVSVRSNGNVMNNLFSFYPGFKSIADGICPCARVFCVGVIYGLLIVLLTKKCAY
jgi:hypothetical protein